MNVTPIDLVFITATIPSASSWGSCTPSQHTQFNLLPPLWTKRAHFRGNPLFQATYNIYKKNKKKNSLSFCPFRLVSQHVPDKLSELIVCFSVFRLYVAWKRGLPRKFARFVLFRPIKKRFFLISFGFFYSFLFFRTVAVNFISDLFPPTSLTPIFSKMLFALKPFDYSHTEATAGSHWKQTKTTDFKLLQSSLWQVFSNTYSRAYE